MPIREIRLLRCELPQLGFNECQLDFCQMAPCRMVRSFGRLPRGGNDRRGSAPFGGNGGKTHDDVTTQPAATTSGGGNGSYMHPFSVSIKRTEIGDYLEWYDVILYFDVKTRLIAVCLAVRFLMVQYLRQKICK